MANTRDISVPAMAERLRGETVTIERFEAWVRDAQPGAKLLYGVGDHAKEAAGERVAEFARRYAEAGLVRLEQKRRPASDAPRGHGFDYFAKRLDGGPAFAPAASARIERNLNAYAERMGRRLGR